jgi:hypothetical protein
LDTIEQRLQDQISRGVTAGRNVSIEQLNWLPEPKRWSMAQIYEHMMLGNAPYVGAVEDGIAQGRTGPAPLKHSLVGKLIFKNAGPSGNVPAPKPMVPTPGPYPAEIVDRWAKQTQLFIDLGRSARNIDLCSIKVRNPFIKFLKLNLADAFMIIAEHTERHVQQLEVLAAQAREEIGAARKTG